MRHAYRGEAGHSITTQMILTDDALEVRVVDQGSPVPVAKRTPPYIDFDPEDPDSIPESGRGTFLIHEDTTPRATRFSFLIIQSIVL